MDDKDQNVDRYLEKSIPSLINKVQSGELSKADASRLFANGLKRLNNRQRKMELLNKFNQKLKEINPRLSPRESAYRLRTSPTEPEIIIDGPSSIGSNQQITLSAKTVGTSITEKYDWETQGDVPGVFHSLGEVSGEGSKTFIVKTDPECGSGVLYVTAHGMESDAVGAMTIQIIGIKENKQPPEQQKIGPEDKGGDEKATSDGSETGAESDADETNKQSPWLKKLQDQRKKLVDQFKKKFTKEALAALWKLLLPYMPWIILGLVILIGGIILFASMAQKAGSGAAGSTMHQEVDTAADADLLQKVMLATGDTETKTNLNNQIFPDIQKKLTSLKDNADSGNQQKIDDTLLKIDKYISSNDPTLGKEIVSDVKDILTSLGTQAPTITVPTRTPLDKITDYNYYLHYGTPLRPEMPTDGTGHATYMNTGEGKADAVDLYTAKGSDIFPIFAGQIVDISDDGTGHKKIIIKNGLYKILYANFDPISGLKTGQNIDTKSSIGKVVDINGQSQIHLELSYQDKPIVTTELDKIDYKDSQRTWGEYLWQNMMKVLNLK